MKTNLKARNLDLGERLRSQVERKLRRLDRITHAEAEVEVELIANASHANDASQVAEVTLLNNGQVLRSSASGSTPIAALDIVVDKLERQLVRSKERPGSVRKRRADETVSVLEHEATKTIDEGEEELPAFAGPSVVKTKRFDMLPMFPEDAIDQMEELGHAFFVYLSAETDEVAVLYRRNDGNYGLIEPAVDRGRGSSNRKGR